MRVTMLDDGHFTSAAGIWRRGEEMERQVRFPIPAYPIEAGKERILVDTGLHPDAAADAARHYEGAEPIGLFKLEGRRHGASRPRPGRAGAGPGRGRLSEGR